MKRLSKEQNEQRAALAGALADIAEEIVEAHGLVVHQVEALNVLIIKYNEAVSEAETWREEITNTMGEYVEGRSDNWQESEAGSEYSEWMDTYADLSFEAMEEVTAPDLPEFELAQQIEDLPDQPG
jgi:uncharacterized coiled-coil DUF342 family protein